MKITKAVRELAIKHKISVKRDHNGIYTIWDSRRADSVKYPMFTETSQGAINRIITLSAGWFKEFQNQEVKP